jgi:nicotinamidase-related amidase
METKVPYIAETGMEKAALLIMHYQADVFSILAETIPTDLLHRTNALIAEWRSSGNPTIFANFAIDYGSGHENNMLINNIKKTGFFRNPAPASGLDIVDSDWRYACRRANVFHDTSLHCDLQDHGINTLVMAGVASSGVLFSTVGWASDADYKLYIVRDCCFDPDLAAHDALFRTSFATRAVIL